MAISQTAITKPRPSRAIQALQSNTWALPLNQNLRQRNAPPLEVSWSVRPQCTKVDINSLSNWCKSNVFKEDHAHGVRKLVANPALLSTVK